MAKIASFPLPNAAVTTVLPHWPGSAGAALLITTFAAFGKEPVSVVSNIEDVIAGKAAAAPVTLEAVTGWTNYAELVPTGALPVNSSVVATAGGFLVPGHQTGSIDLFHVTAPNNVSHMKISTDKSGFFYHKIVWHDCNDDGRLDVMAARARVPNVGKKQGELIWLEQPVTGALAGGPWKEHLLSAGPDVDFLLSAHANSGSSSGAPPAVVAAQYFSAPQLAVYRCAGVNWAACDEGAGVSVEVLDAELGPFFAVQEADLDADGLPDLLVANSRSDPTGALLVYSKPANASGYARHVLASGYAPAPKPLAGPGRGAPGKPFALPASSPGAKPRVLLSGDDGGFASVLTPTSAAAGEWGYAQTYLFNSSGTIGELSWMLNATGGLVAFVPFYSEGRIEAWALP